MSGNICWLASYPKSGNTWMRVLLTNYLLDGDEPADINALAAGLIASARQIFDDHVGIEASDLTQDEIERLRPAVYEMLSDSAAPGPDDQVALPMLLKVHDAYTRTVDDVPLISKAATAGAIYLVRDPRDVAVSFAHHGAVEVDVAVRNMGRPDHAFVDNPHRLHSQLRQRILTWSQHVESWIDEPGLRVLVVRYEDLSSDTAGELTRVLEFLGIDSEPDLVAKAVDFSRFDRLQQQEADTGFGERMPLAESFFRKGTVGSWRESLSEELVDQLVAEHGAVMRRFGYLEQSQG